MGNWSSRYNYNSTDVNRYAPSNGGVYRLIYKRTENSMYSMWDRAMILKGGCLNILVPPNPIHVLNDTLEITHVISDLLK